VVLCLVLLSSCSAAANATPSAAGAKADIATTEGGLFVCGLPLGYYGGLAKQIDAVDAAEVERVAKKYLHPESMLVIAVGDRARIAPELEKLDLGPVQQVP
jgi:zinc protease